MNRLVEAVSPARLGPDFRRLLGSSILSNLADGIGLAAAPLLMAAQTRSPLLIASAGLLQRLPWLLFGLHAGVIADRLDRRLIIVTVNGFRALLLMVLAASVAVGAVNAYVVLTALFLFGIAETLVDTTGGTLLPMMLTKKDLGLGNSRLIASQMTVNQLVGPPVGAALFLAGMAIPFAAQAVLLVFAALIVSKLAVARTVGGAAANPDSPLAATMHPEGDGVLAEILAGVRWLWEHPPVRTLALTIIAFNVTFGATFSILVLYSIERLQLGEVGFGLLTSVVAVGGVLGAAVYGRLERRFSLANMMRAGLIIETLTHLGLALTTTPVVAMAMLFLFGAHASVWGTTSSTIRQRAVPEEFQGRVASVYITGLQGGLVVGAGIGGILANWRGILTPFWFAFAGSLVLVFVLWRELANIAATE